MNIGKAPFRSAYTSTSASLPGKKKGGGAEELGFDSFGAPSTRSIRAFDEPLPGSKTASTRRATRPSSIFRRAGACLGHQQTIKLATGIVLVPDRHPLLLAKEISTLDLSAAAGSCRIGAGWLGENPDHGRYFEHRWTQTRESIRP